MSEFSSTWLELREPADHAARNRDVLQAVAAWAARRPSLAIVDLGAGTGSNLRACALALPVREQRWTLVDRDAALLSSARAALTAWADSSTERGGDLVLRKDAHTLTVSFANADIAHGVEAQLAGPVDLVTAAALFDLVSAEWIARFAGLVAARRLPLYASLTYDGEEEWHPPHDDDAAIHRAFLSHQQRDKGFGPSAGPSAVAVLAGALQRSGYAVVTGVSPWRLTSGEAPLVTELAEGIAVAASETGAVTQAVASRWLEFRRRSLRTPAASVRIGHLDLWAAPGG